MLIATRILLVTLYMVLTVAFPQGYNYQQGTNSISTGPSNNGFIPSTGPCCQQLALLKSQQTSFGQSNGRILNSHGSNTLNNVQDFGSKGYNYQTKGSVGGNIVTGHLVVANPNGQNVVNKYSSSADSGYNGNSIQSSTLFQSNGFGISQGSNGYVSTTGVNYNGAASNRYATTAKLAGQGSGSLFSSTIGKLSGSASDKSYTQSSHSTEFSSGNIQSPLVEKHIYVHVPPEDISESASAYNQRQQQLLQAKKHYKIIFIKAPTVASSAPSYSQLLANGGLSQEKTLVYVLVKKPEEPTDEELKALHSQASQHSKPEVYFIKYKTRNGQNNGEQYSGGYAGSDLAGVDVRSSGSEIASTASVTNAVHTDSYASKSNSVVNEVSSSYIPPNLNTPSPSPVYGVPSAKK